MFMPDEAENRPWCTSKDHGGPAIQKLVVKIAYISLHSCIKTFLSHMYVNTFPVRKAPS